MTILVPAVATAALLTAGIILWACIVAAVSNRVLDTAASTPAPSSRPDRRRHRIGIDHHESAAWAQVDSKPMAQPTLSSLV